VVTPLSWPNPVNCCSVVPLSTKEAIRLLRPDVHCCRRSCDQTPFLIGPVLGVKQTNRQECSLRPGDCGVPAGS